MHTAEVQPTPHSNWIYKASDTLITDEQNIMQIVSFGIHSRQQKDPRRRTSCSQNHSKHLPDRIQHSAHSKLNGQDGPHIKPNYKLFSVWTENAKGQLRSYNQTRFLQHIQVSCKAICLLVFNTNQFHGRSKNSGVRSEKHLLWYSAI